MRRTVSFERLERILGQSDGQQEVTNRRELKTAKAVLRRALTRELTARQLECVQLYYYEGLTEEEVGARLGIGKSTVCRHLQRARKRLQWALSYAGAARWEEPEE